MSAADLGWDLAGCWIMFVVLVMLLAPLASKRGRR